MKKLFIISLLFLGFGASLNTWAAAGIVEEVIAMVKGTLDNKDLCASGKNFRARSGAICGKDPHVAAYIYAVCGATNNVSGFNGSDCDTAAKKEMGKGGSVNTFINQTNEPDTTTLCSRLPASVIGQIAKCPKS